MRDTRGEDYAERLATKGGARWKRVLNVQAPYRWNLRRLKPGFVLDVGCGLGRNLGHLDGNGVGVDHNATAVSVARAAGLTAFTPEEFHASEHATEGRFDTLLMAHVAEHMTPSDAAGLIAEYAPFVRSGGGIVLICPQERGYRSDPTHVTFTDLDAMAALVEGADGRVERRMSFPFPRAAGRLFTYNEFVVAGRLP